MGRDQDARSQTVRKKNAPMKKNALSMEKWAKDAKHRTISVGLLYGKVHPEERLAIIIELGRVQGKTNDLSTVEAISNVFQEKNFVYCAHLKGVRAKSRGCELATSRNLPLG